MRLEWLRITVAVCWIAVTGRGLAAEIYWEGDTDTDFNNGLNWAGDAFPGTGDAASIQNGVYNVQLNGTPANATTEIWMGNNGGNGGLTMTAGTVDTTWFVVGRNGGSMGADGVFSMSGGTVNAAQLIMRENGCSGAVSLSGNAVYNGSGYTVIGNGWDAGGLGTLTVESNAQFNNNGDFNLAEWGVAVGTLTLRDNGIVRVCQTGGALYIGRWDDAVGTVNQDGGRFEAWGGDARIGGNGSGSPNAQGIYNLTNGVVVIHPNFQVGAYGKGTFNQYGGVVTNEAWMAIGRYGGSVGVYNLMGGTLEKNANAGGLALIVGEDGNGTLNISGNGHLDITGWDLRLGNVSGAQGTLRITGSSATIDVAGYANLRYNAGATTALEITADAGGVSPINTGGDVSLNNCALTANLAAMPPYQNVTLINNGSVNPVNGTFNGLVEGAVVPGTYDRTITYAGGDGNDVVLVAQAGSGHWTGAVSTDFNLGGNWSQGTFPTVIASIQNGDTDVALGATPPNALPQLWLGNAGNDGGLTQTAGDLTVNSWLVLGRQGGVDGAEGRFDMDGGTMANGGNLILGETGNCSGTMVISNGATYTGSGYVSVGVGNGSTGTMTLAGNAVLTSDENDFNVSDWGSSRGTLVVKDNATLNATRNAGQIYVGKNGTSRGWLYQSGGSIDVRVSNFGSAAGAQGTVDISGGTYHGSAWMNIAILGAAAVTVRNDAQLLNDGDLNVADNSGQATLNVQDNAFVRAAQSGGAFYVGKNGTGVGVVNQTGGRVEVYGDQETRIGGVNGASSAAQGTYNLSAGSFSVLNQNLQVGGYGIGIFNQTGGAVTNNGWLVVGRFGGSVGTYNISSGVLRKTAGPGAAMIIAEGGNGTLNVSGDADVGVQGDLRMGNLATGVGKLSITGSTATISISGNLNLHTDGSSSTELEMLANGSGVTPITVGGDVTLNNADLTVDMTPRGPYGEIPLIDNQGANPVVGTFQLLPEGALVTASADRTISYVGGDGNDVVLMPTLVPPQGTAFMVK